MAIQRSVNSVTITNNENKTKDTALRFIFKFIFADDYRFRQMAPLCATCIKFMTNRAKIYF